MKIAARKSLSIAGLLALTLALAGSTKCTGTSGDAQIEEMRLTDANQQRLMAAQPAPVIDRSAERENLIERLQRWNNTEKTSYIYLVSFGRIMAFYTVRGKVSSVNSYLTTSEQVINSSNGNVVIESPDLDGSYGSNGDGIFFFTTEGVYVEWNGEYLLCDQPLQISQPPEMVMQVQSEGQ